MDLGQYKYVHSLCNSAHLTICLTCFKYSLHMISPSYNGPRLKDVHKKMRNNTTMEMERPGVEQYVVIRSFRVR